MNKHVGFESGTLRKLVAAATIRAQQTGVLEPIQTDCRHWMEKDVEFLIRVVQKQTRKPLPDAADYGNPAKANPFLPYEPHLHVADISDTHVCVLNKYNVVDHHLLIITRVFEHQESPLTEADFMALWRCLAEYDSLGFYNSGVVAGASQPHKHLQLVPLPLADSETPKIPIPIEAILTAEKSARSQITQLPKVPFHHQIVFWDEDPIRSLTGAVRVSLEAYQKMLQRVGFKYEAAPQSTAETHRVNGPYNLLVTRRWMLLVPRRHECFHGISLNALAFAGAMLVHTEEQYSQLVQAGPMAALRHAAGADGSR